MHPIMPYTLLVWSWLPTWAVSALIVFGRYLLMAGGTYWVVYRWQTARTARFKIQQRSPNNQIVQNEIRHSFYTALIFGGIAAGLFVARQAGYTRQYLDIQTHSWLYFGSSVGMLVLIHDTYFYWLHRAMHQPNLYRWIHRTHHRSVNPTPMAALSFHPLEAILEFAFIPITVFVFPIHPLALGILAFWSMVWNIVGHLGYEFFPSGITRHWLGQWLNTATHHNLHHQKGRLNYGLYFNVWDRLMGTNHPTYLSTFDTIRERATQSTQTSEATMPHT